MGFVQEKCHVTKTFLKSFKKAFEFIFLDYYKAWYKISQCDTFHELTPSSDEYLMSHKHSASF